MAQKFQIFYAPVISQGYICDLLTLGMRAVLDLVVNLEVAEVPSYLQENQHYETVLNVRPNYVSV
jgi:hypothetical protein